MTEIEKLVFALTYVRGLEINIGGRQPGLAVLDACKAVQDLRETKGVLVLSDYSEIMNEVTRG